MEFFIDTGEIDEIKEAATWGFIDGVTTNPSLVAKSGKTQDVLIREIVEIIDGPISAEVIATDYEGMLSEIENLKGIHNNVVIKLPLTLDGLRACKWCSANDIKTNVTLCFSANQALLAAKNGATYISPFVGRVDDIGQDGMLIIEEIRNIYDNYGFTTKILTASVRHSDHVKQAAMIGSDVATVPYKVLKQLVGHPLTEKGLDQFLSDHKNSQK